MAYSNSFYSYFTKVLNAFGLQNFITIGLYIFLSYVYYYFEWFIHKVNKFFISNYERKSNDEYLKNVTPLLCNNPNVTEKEQLRIKLFFIELLQLNYYINYLYQNNEIEKIKEISDEIYTGNKYCIYSFEETGNKVLGAINVKKLLLVADLDCGNGCNVLLFNLIGTNNFEDIITDIRLETSSFGNVLLKNKDTEKSIQIHDGFLNTSMKSVFVYKTDICNYNFINLTKDENRSIAETILSIIQKNKKDCTKIYFSGHSLGGALSIINYLFTISHTELNIPLDNIFLYTFGSPKISNVRLDTYLSNVFPNINLNNVHITVNDNDIVQTLPFGSPMYLLNYEEPFPSRVEKIKQDRYSSYFNIVKGIQNHMIRSYFNTLEAEYKNAH